MDTVHAVLNVHVCTNVYPKFLLYSNGHLLTRLLGSPLLLLHHLGHHIWLGCTWNVAAVENLWVLQWCYAGRQWIVNWRGVLIIRGNEG